MLGGYGRDLGCACGMDCGFTKAHCNMIKAHPKIGHHKQTRRTLCVGNARAWVVNANLERDVVWVWIGVRVVPYHRLVALWSGCGRDIVCLPWDKIVL